MVLTSLVPSIVNLMQVPHCFRNKEKLSNCEKCSFEVNAEICSLVGDSTALILTYLSHIESKLFKRQFLEFKEKPVL